MLISPIVAHLRAACPTFAGRVVAGIDWDAVAASTQLSHPSAYVIATGDQATANDIETGIRQNITDEIDVVIVLDTTDERGQAANDLLHIIRTELWRALVGWTPGADYELMEYDGGALVHINRARVIYRYGFSAEFQLGRNRATDLAETWHERELDGLPPLEGFDIDVDYIEPMFDKNITDTGPDGRIETHLREDLPQ
jgi:hypothetical protein